MVLPLLSALVLAAGPAFIEDDFARALKKAKTEKKLLFVDAWAPWCHTCVAMREQVFTRESFKAFEKDVVFAAVDTEKLKSAAFLEKYPVRVWPTLLFIEPASGAVKLTWLGSADEAQMRALLVAAKLERGVVRTADDALARGELATAGEKYRAALASGSLEARTVLSMLSALTLAKDHAACATTAIDTLSTMQEPADRVAALTWGLSCALSLPPGPPRAQAVEALTTPALEALKLPNVLADDVSGLYEVLVEARSNAGQIGRAQELALQWYQFLTGHAEAATRPAERAVFDPHRVNAAIASGHPEWMVEPLLTSEKELPQDYNPPARLALIYRELKRFEEGLQAIDRALSRCEGPRKLRLYETKASLLERTGDEQGRLQTLRAAVAYANKLPKSQVTSERIAALEAAAGTARR